MQDAARVLLETCLRAAHERHDVRRSLSAINAWLTRELERMPPESAGSTSSSPRGRAEATGGGQAHGVLTPAARSRADGDSADAEASDGTQRITTSLSVVVTRARWKAAACRLSLDKRNARASDDSAAAESTGSPSGTPSDTPSGESASGAKVEPIAAREASLRTRLTSLPDTSTWMLDMPFGKRISESDAFDVDPVTAAKLGQVADCYDAIATGAEIAMDLDESGSFRGGPPAAFLYLLAESQSALLQSLAGAPTRSDSDQRDIFLWLKEQTTRYRIYVDRYMRLDDPADPTLSKDLTERLRRSAREIADRAKGRHERSQVLSKVRYHVRKIVGSSPILSSEIESLEHALEAWAELGGERNDRHLADALAPLRELSKDASEELLDLLGEYPTRDGRRGKGANADGDDKGTIRPLRAASTAGISSSQSNSSGVAPDPERAKALLDEVQSLLDTQEVMLLTKPSDDVATAAQVDALGKALGARKFSVVTIDPAEDVETRAASLRQLVESDTQLFLLGIRFESEEYKTFKEACLARERLFVRLPGSLEASAIAHQISRQVGWRLRALKEEKLSE